MKKLLILLLVLGLPGCATKLMKASIGKPIEEVIIKRGNDFTMTELDDGRRMYQWTETFVEEQTGVTYGKEKTEHGKTKRGWNVTKTTGWSISAGGGSTTRTCRYIYFASFNEPSKTWMVSSIKKPGWRC